jgi:rare lipoprotein A (peptidoglycan hydrolase)
MLRVGRNEPSARARLLYPFGNTRTILWTSPSRHRRYHNADSISSKIAVGSQASSRAAQKGEMRMPNRYFNLSARRVPRQFALLACAVSLAGCVTTGTNVATAPSRTAGELKTASVALPRPQALPYFRAPHASPKSFDGVASYYSEGSQVATGARFEPNGLTAAHRWLPFGTRVRVSDPKTGRSVVVTINDRGPFVQGRVLDLSLGAARALGIQGRGVSRVHGEVM